MCIDPLQFMSQFQNALDHQLNRIQEKAEDYDLSEELSDETLSKWRDLVNQFDKGETEQEVFLLLDAILEVGEAVGIPKSELLSEVAVHLYEGEAPTVNPTQFRPSVPRPDGLSMENLREAVNLTQERIFRINLSLIESTGSPLIDYIQSNNYSGIVSNILTDALGEVSSFEKHHDREHPDLKNEDGVGLEIKAANRAGKGGESHNGHGGWHLVAGFQHQRRDGSHPICAHSDRPLGAIPRRCRRAPGLDILRLIARRRDRGAANRNVLHYSSRHVETARRIRVFGYRPG